MVDDCGWYSAWHCHIVLCCDWRYSIGVIQSLEFLRLTVLTVTATIGIPRSGKSTYAQEQLKRNTTLRRVNRDDIRALIAHESIHNTNPFENEVSEVQHLLIVKHLKKGHDVIVDNTNVKPERIADLRESIQEFCNETNTPVMLQTKLFDTDIDECLKRNEECKKRGDRYVPPEIIRAMHGNLSKNLNNHTLKEMKEIIHPSAPITQNPSLPSVVLCDLDGTVANISHRDPYDASKCISDEPIMPIIDLIKVLSLHHKIIFVSGRDSTYREDTQIWLLANNLYGDLIMREIGDSRKDSIIKKEILVNKILPHYSVALVVDDRDQVVRMWRDAGITCLQVAYGDF